MGFFDYFPYTNFHELNLNWLLHVVKELQISYLEQSKTIEEIQEKIKNLDVPEIVKEQINDMIKSGELTDLFTPTWKDLYTKNKRFWLGDLYIISETAVNNLPQLGSKFAHYNNILYNWDDQLLQLTNTLTNTPSSNSASLIVVLVQTTTPYSTYFNIANTVATFRNRFPSAEVYLCAINNYDYIRQSSYQQSNCLIGCSTSPASLASNIQRMVTGIPTFFSAIPFVVSETARISDDYYMPGARTINTPATIRNMNGTLFTERWMYTEELLSLTSAPTTIVGPIGYGTFQNSERGALWRLSRSSQTIEIYPMEPKSAQIGTNTMYSNSISLY